MSREILCSLFLVMSKLRKYICSISKRNHKEFPLYTYYFWSKENLGIKYRYKK